MDTVKTSNGHVSGLKLGDMIDFKIKPGRGRPQKGVLLEKRPGTILVTSSAGERIEVPVDKIIGQHTTRYTERQRRLL